MKKVILEFCVTVLFFFALWFGLAQINWVNIFKIEEVSEKTEETLGELTWEIFSDSEYENTNEFITKTVDSLVTHIVNKNNINRREIKLHIVDSDEVNAFALPDGHLIINSQLIIQAENQEELAGVIAHELAHIELNHISEKLAKEIGLTVVISAVTGNNNQAITKIVKTLTSTAFDRKNEEEADLTAVIYLENANINPVPFSKFLNKLATEEVDDTYPTWLSTHPNSEYRAKSVIKAMNKSKTNYSEVISKKTMDKLQEKLIDSN